MDENELRTALRQTITLHPEPPPMESATAITAARRAQTRRNLLAGIGSAAAILGITLAVIPGQAQTGGGTDLQVAAEPSGAVQPFPAGTPSWAGSAPAGGEKTEPVWPPENGGDATADSGPHYQHGKKLLTSLLAVVPDGYEAKSGATSDGIPFRSDQATIQNDGSYWTYLASVAIGKGDGVGELIVEVSEPGNGLPQDACAVAKQFWGRGGDCTPVTVGDAKVGVIHEGDGTAWAGYRHSDGTVVYVMQSTAPTYADPRANGLKPLEELPLSDAELAALATDASLR
ncbi:hypothetical protein Aph02nite_02420 [Actinoplanes philippinensis]|uniref:Uncharacterized protein n=1 Tax=Actinoplanes philippinensis TaxID=35752 RepID=A0A1I2DEE7_9ACTN|nr:hypothetical protein [Actinoplanes philippinensis]GIE74292.1 hypothetical protein Aph02nite_02420 [Actinoplanes philippinensis]SFE78972.1 hypothetical protein SAMN05421541_103588 [Actinoplanes philippinensis]